MELDAGFKPGREYGRGASGGQVRDDRGGGSGRDRRSGEFQRNEQSSRPRWEAPPGVKTEPGHYGPAGDAEGAVAGEKRSRDENMGDGDQASKNPRYEDDDNL